MNPARILAAQSDVALSPVIGPLFEAVSRGLDRRRIVRIAQTDSEVALETLRVVNSAWFRRQRAPVADLDHAVALIGVDRLVEIVANLAGAALRRQDLEAYRLMDHALWRMTLATAYAAQRIGQLTGLSEPQCYTIGLLLDIGKLAMGDALTDAPPAPSSQPFDAFESDHAGCNHAEVGAVIARDHGLPESIARAIELHHSPGDDADPYVHTGHVASIVAMQLFPAGVEGHRYRLHRKSLDLLGLDETRAMDVMAAGLQGLSEADRWLEPLD